MNIINLTQHPATPDQIAAGVMDFPEFTGKIRELLTFEELPTLQEMSYRAQKLVQVVNQIEHQTKQRCDAVMIGGAPFLMSTLAITLAVEGFRVCYAFSKRVSVEKTLDDGTVQKINQFKHEGFIYE